MKRKFLFILALCFVVIFSALVFIACNNDNGNNEGGSDNDIALPSPTDPDEDNTQHVHSYGEWIITKSATCKVEGSQSRYCSCGEVQTISIGVLGHTIQSHAAQTASCTAKGWKEYDTCSRCDYTTYEEISALGHTIQSHAAQTASCTAKGWKEYDTCSRCDYTTYEEIGALGHTIQSHAAQTASCTAKGWKEYDTCSRCVYTTYEEISALGHTIQSHAAQTASCTAKGWKEYDTCSRCDYTTYEEVEALGHDFTGIYLNNSSIHWHICLNNCGETDGMDMHKFDSNDRCYDCGYSIIYTPNLAYTLSDDGTYYILSGIGDAVGTYIRSLHEVNGKPVKEVAANAFAGNTEITELYLPASFTQIGVSAFENCSNLSNVYLPDSITQIGRRAFASCSGLNKIYLLDACTSIGENAFIGTAFFNDRTNWIDNTLYIGANLISVRTTALGVSKIKDGTVIIADGAYGSCANIIGIEIPESVKFIGNNAFDGCSSIESITINEDVVCNAKLDGLISLKQANIPVYLINSLSKDFLANILQELTVTGVGEIERLAFKDFTSLKTVIINDGVTAIGYGAFRGCNNLLKMTLPFVGNSCNAEGYMSVFGYIFGYTTLAFSSGNGEYNYDYKKTYDGAFNQYVIRELNYQNGKERFEDRYYFYYIPTSLQSVKITGNKLPDNAFCNSELPNILLVGEVTQIKYMTFYGCAKLIDLTLPNSVTSIASKAFSGCRSLTRITIPNSVTSMAFNAFSGCTELIQTVDGVQYVDNWVVDCNTSITEVYLRSNTKGIATAAFMGCSSLTKITIPDSVTSIGEKAFSGCTELIQTVDGVQYVDNWVVGCNTSITEVYLGSYTKGIATAAFRDCSSLTRITIPDSVISIGEYVFCFCIETIFYIGAAEDWDKNIKIDGYNPVINDKTLYYYSETEPTMNLEGTKYDGNYWHYDTDGITPVIWKIEN